MADARTKVSCAACFPAKHLSAMGAVTSPMDPERQRAAPSGTSAPRSRFRRCAATGTTFMPQHANDIRIVIAPPHPLTGRFRDLDRARQGPHLEFAELLRRDECMRG
jgi:hypothetical protein